MVKGAMMNKYQVEAKVENLIKEVKQVAQDFRLIGNKRVSKYFETVACDLACNCGWTPSDIGWMVSPNIANLHMYVNSFARLGFIDTYAKLYQLHSKIFDTMSDYAVINDYLCTPRGDK